MVYSSVIWETLFRRYLWDEILALATGSENEATDLVIDFNTLQTCFIAEAGLEAVDYFENNPDAALADANRILHTLDLPEISSNAWGSVYVAISSFPTKAIRKISHSDIGHYVSFTATIMRKTDVAFKVVDGAFKCKRCDHVTHVPQPEGKFIEPFECEDDVCGRKGAFVFVPAESIFVNRRKLQLQESFESITGGEQVLSKLDAVIYGSGDVFCPPLGSLATVSGILRSIQVTNANGKKPEFVPLLEVNNIKFVDSDELLALTNEDLQNIERLKNSPDIVDILVRSTVPSVKGYPQIKEAGLCSIVSPDSLLLPEGRQFRGHTHIALVGDPSVAKSVLMRGWQRLVPRAQYAAGRSSTTKGLTVSVNKDAGGWGEGGWVADAGMLVLADRSLALIDELNQFEKEEQAELNTPLESGIIPIHKAGINRDFYARCPIIAGMNPKYGRFDRYEPMEKQINVPAATLSRFDLVFLMIDEPKKSDVEISNHIIGLVTKASRLHKLNGYDTTEALTAAWGIDKYTPKINETLLKKWIQEAKKIKVEITPECGNAIGNFFMSVRLSSPNPDSGLGNNTVPVVWRNLDGMLRLLISQARLRLSDTTTMADVQRVIALIQECFKTITDPLTGKLDSDIISVGMGGSQRERIKTVKKIIRTLQEENGTDALIDDIVERAESLKIKKDSVDDIIQKLKTMGELLERSNNRYRVVN